MDLSLDSTTEEKSVVKGDLLFKAGESVKNLYLVSSGQLMGFNLSDDKRVIPLYVANPGDIVGEECIYEKNHNYSVAALVDSVLVPVEMSEVKNFLTSSPEWVSKIIEIISSRLVMTQEMIREHKIIDPLLNDGADLEASDETFIKKLI